MKKLTITSLVTHCATTGAFLLLLATTIGACGQATQQGSAGGVGGAPPSSAQSGADELQRWHTRTTTASDADEMQRWRAHVQITPDADEMQHAAARYPGAGR